MASEITGTKPLVGFLVPDRRIKTDNLDDTLSSYTQASPRPGVPASDDDSSMVIQTGGAQTKDLDLRAQRGGYPGGAEIMWREDGDPVTAWRGWERPLAIMDELGYAHSGAGWACIDMARTSSGDLIAMMGEPAAVSGIDWDVLVYDRDSETWTKTDDVIQYDAAGYDALKRAWSPALCPLPDGRILAFLPVPTAQSATTMQVDVWIADDDSLTSWTIYASAVLPGEVTTSGGAASSVGRLRAAYSSGQILLMMETTQGTGETVPGGKGFRQYASADMGVTFTLVDDWDDSMTSTTYQGWRQDIAVTPAGQLVVLYARLDSSDTHLYAALPASAYEAVRTATEVQVSTIDADEVSVSEDGGLLIALYRTTASSGAISSRYASVDDPETWTMWGGYTLPQGSNARLGGWYRGTATPQVGSGLVAALCGRALHVLGYMSDYTADGLSAWLTRLQLGGWSSVTGPTGYSASLGTYTMGPAAVAIAGHNGDLVDPEAQGWTLSGVSISYLLTSWRWSLSSASGYYTASLSATVDSGIYVSAEMMLDTSGSVTSDLVAIGLRTADGTDDYWISVRLSSTGIAVYDKNASATLATATVDLTDWTQIRIAMRKVRVRVWTKTASDTAWTDQVDVLTLSDNTSSPGTTVSCTWGHLVSGSELSRWKYVQAWATAEGVHSQQNPHGAVASAATSVRGAPIGTHHMHLTGGTTVRAITGPAELGETWTLDRVYDYAVDHIHPYEYPSVDTEWRSTSDTSDVDIVWDLADGAATTMGSIYAVYMGSHNIRSCTWDTYDGSTWTTRATLLAPTDMQTLPYLRRGDRLVVDPSGTGSSAGRYIARNELAGGHVLLSSGVVRPIVGNTEGIWEVGSAAKQAIIYLDPDALDGTEPTSGTMEIWPPSILAIVGEQVALPQRVRLHIPAQDTYEGYFRIGILAAGPVAVVGRETAAGRIIETAANYTLYSTASGARTAKKEGSPRRIAQVAWSDDDTSQIMAASPSPDYVQLRDGVSPAVATYHDTALLLAGLLTEQTGAVRPVVYLPSIPEAATTITTSPEDFLYGRIVSAIKRTAQMGDPGVSEVVTVDKVTIEEEV